MIQRFEYDIDLYPREVLIKSAYRFIDEAYIHLDKDDDKYIVEIKDKDELRTVSKERFDEEMLIQSARFVVAKKTKDIRKMTMARAFASTLIDEHRVEENFDEEDNQIGVSEDILRDWFENE